LIQPGGRRRDDAAREIRALEGKPSASRPIYRSMRRWLRAPPYSPAVLTAPVSIILRKSARHDVFGLSAAT